jgi:uncharacterized membrane protein YgaE (UPF0421/DUF939 family)
MTGTELGVILTGVGTILTAVGGAFAWLINQVVNTSKEAVKELRLLLEAERADHGATESERDLWRQRAYRAGWKEGDP